MLGLNHSSSVEAAHESSITFTAYRAPSGRVFPRIVEPLVMDAPCPALLVLNAGSSTLKFSLYLAAASAAHCLGSGSIEVRRGRAMLVYQDSGSGADHQEQWIAESCMDAVSLGNLMR